jgi:hypothetical protein
VEEVGWLAKKIKAANESTFDGRLGCLLHNTAKRIFNT